MFAASLSVHYFKGLSPNLLIFSLPLVHSQIIRTIHPISGMNNRSCHHPLRLISWSLLVVTDMFGIINASPKIIPKGLIWGIRKMKASNKNTTIWLRFWDFYPSPSSPQSNFTSVYKKIINKYWKRKKVRAKSSSEKFRDNNFRKI